MTRELAKACNDRTPPFHGDTCEVKDLNSIQLWSCYKVAVSLVTAAAPAEVYRSVQDWHLHDGVITAPTDLSAADWEAWLESPENLLEAWEAEDYCHRTVYPPDMAWCLRFLSSEEYGELPDADHPNYFELDLSGDPSLVRKFADTIRELYLVEPQIKGSSEWFVESGETDLSPENL